MKINNRTNKKKKLSRNIRKNTCKKDKEKEGVQVMKINQEKITIIKIKKMGINKTNYHNINLMIQKDLKKLPRFL